MELSIIIVNFNTSDLTRRCLNKVYKSLSFGKIEKSSEVIVIDNASDDGSISMIQKHFPKVILIKNNKNLGFSKANNQGIKKTTGAYILLLNSDTQLKTDTLAKLLETVKGDNTIGVVGGKLENIDGTTQPSVGYFPNLSKVFFWMFFIDDIPLLSKILKPYHLEDKSFYGKKHFIDWVSGACFLLRREVVGKVGLLDENIFMYGEEMEWCYRIKKAGFKVMYTPQAQIKHYKGASSKSEGGIIEEFGAILYFYNKHKPAWQIPILRFVLRSGALLRLVIFGIIGRYKTRLPLYAKAFKLAR